MCGDAAEEAGASPARSRHCHQGCPREPGTPVAVFRDYPGRGPRLGVRVFLLLSTSDTDLLSARAGGRAWRLANPARTAVDDLPALLDGVDLIVVRILGGRRAWAEGIDVLLAGDVPVVVLGGE